MGKMAIVQNEYYLKERIYAKKHEHSISGRTKVPDSKKHLMLRVIIINPRRWMFL
jgi:hypothetical protein